MLLYHEDLFTARLGLFARGLRSPVEPALLPVFFQPSHGCILSQRIPQAASFARPPLLADTQTIKNSSCLPPGSAANLIVSSTVFKPLLKEC
jgi:hypothetical protein